MKKIYKQKNQGLLVKTVFFFLLTFFSISIHAQKEIEISKRYLNENAAKQQLSAADIAEMSVSSEYLSPTTGWYHIYFNQMYQSVEVYNGMLNLTLQNGEVKYVANTFVPFLAGTSPNVSLNRILTPMDALIKAAQFKNLTPSKSTQIQTLSSLNLADGSISKASYQDNNLSDEPVNVKLYWLPYQGLENGKSTEKMVLAWNVNFLTKDGKNKWNIHVDANTGEILKEYDDIIHCDFGVPNKDGISEGHEGHAHTQQETRNNSLFAPNQYNVFDYPLEAPTFGSRTFVSSPYNRFAPTGTGPDLATNGWHSDGTTSYTNTKGNNVDAKDDLANDNEGTIGSSPSSASLDFNYTYSQTTGSAATNLNAAITNLFYWNNVIHDVLWRYGFDEPSGNFQKNNMGRGGAGNDFVFADAQDGSGTNNANFSTPEDGSNGRMQMFIFSNAGSPAYQPDSDFDNGVIAHEYGHGWSIRLTGGPANSNCLRNAEQGGEGWSDYIALMTTTNWSSLTPTLASANIPRGIGTYVLGQATTGLGIRPFKYSYDKANINNTVTYAGVGNAGVFSQPHGIGSIWATMLWDMTWEIIFQDNQIVGDIYTVPASITDMRGNIAALKLVNEGLRLQPCSPSFVQARDAILQADAMLFGGRYHCAIAKAFARRGLGANASTGISTNDRTVTEDFTSISGPALSSSNLATTCSNQVFNYTATSNAIGATFSWTRPVVSGISNSTGSGSNANISETLINTTTEPITVKYLFTIAPNDCPGSTTVQVVNVTVDPNITPIVAAYSVCQNASVPSGQGLVGAAATNSVNSIINPGNFYIRGSGNNTTTYVQAQFVFYKAITFVAPSSAAVTFTITAAAITGTDPFDTYLSLYQTSFNPNSPATNFLRGDDDSGPLQNSSKLTQTLTAGQTYILVVSTFGRFQSGTFTLQATSTVAADAIGFGIDQKWFASASGGNAIFTGRVLNPVGLAGSGIPNTSTPGSTTFYVADAVFPDCRTAAVFTVGISVGGSVTADATVCTGSNSGTLTLAGHTGTILRWESSIDNFTTIVPIANTTTSQSYTNLTQTTKYRAVVQNGACAAANSTPATIMVTSGTVAGAVTADATVCTGSNSGTLTLAGQTGTILRWESSIDNFVTIVTISNTTTTQNYSNLTQTTKYRAVVQNGTCTLANSSPATITVTNGTVAGAVTADATVCTGSNSGTLTLAGHTGSILRWESSIDNFVTIVTIANTTTSQSYTNLTQTTKYRAVVQNGACTAANSSPATITVTSATVAGTVTADATVCTGSNSGTLTLAGHTGTILRWESSIDNFVTIVTIANTTTSQSFTNLTQTTKYRAVVQNGACTAANSSPATITVTSGTVAGAVTADAIVCTGINSGTLTLAGHTGIILRWESSIDNFVTIVTISNTTTSQSYTNLTQTTKFRAVVQNGACTEANSSPATITVTSGTVAGAVTSDATVCTGLNSGTLTLAGHTGTILRWESSIDNFATIVTIANMTTSQSYTNLTQTTKYRAVVQNGACAGANSSPATITVIALPSASNTGPYLVGQTISLNASAGTSYSWTGPNSFSSSVSNPTIVNAQNFNAGIYTVLVSNLGCSATATTNVIITGVDPCVQIMTYSYVQAGDPFQTLFPLTNGQKIAKNINQTSIIVKPICPSIPIESVQMNIKGPYDLDWTTLQSYPHFSLYDNAGEYVLGSNLAAGTYTLTVTGYGQKFGYGGTTYGPVVTTFTIVENPPTISTPTLEGTAFCANSNVTINFTTSGTFAPGNTFKVLLSDENGSFNNSPSIIGTTNVAGSVLCTIPSTIVGGENYRVKIISTDLATTGNNNLIALTLNPLVVNLVSPTNDYPSGTITKQATQFINARNNISGVSNVQYKAGNAINLTPGFQVVSSPGSSFKVNIGGCN